MNPAAVRTVGEPGFALSGVLCDRRAGQTGARTLVRYSDVSARDRGARWSQSTVCVQGREHKVTIATVTLRACGIYRKSPWRWRVCRHTVCSVEDERRRLASEEVRRPLGVVESCPDTRARDYPRTPCHRNYPQDVSICAQGIVDNSRFCHQVVALCNRIYGSLVGCPARGRPDLVVWTTRKVDPVYRTVGRLPNGW